MTIVKGNLKASFSIATAPRYMERCYSFPWIAPLYPWSYHTVLSVMQGSIKYHFLSLWYDLTWDWTQVYLAIGKNSTHWANEPVHFIYIYIYIHTHTHILEKDLLLVGRRNNILKHQLVKYWIVQCNIFHIYQI